MNLFQAQRIARAFLLSINPAIGFGAVCGSIRRKEPTVNDAEVVVVPKMAPVPALFDVGERQSMLDPLLEKLVRDGYVEFDRQLERNGERYKRLRKDGLPIDLYICLPPMQLGWLITLRTGPESFTKQIVLPREKGGFLPLDCRINDGLVRKGQLVETPSEEAFFHEMGMRYVAPEYRSNYAPYGKEARAFAR